MKMKRKKIVAITLVLLFTVVVGYAATTTPGSQTDPLVTLSYVDKQIAQLKTYVQELVSKNTGTVSSSTFEKLELLKGQVLLAGAGTEIIPRNGSQLEAVYGEAGGLCDVSAAKDLTIGAKAEVNHLLISAASDGRGVVAKENSWLIIKGDYTIK